MVRRFVDRRDFAAWRALSEHHRIDRDSKEFHERSGLVDIIEIAGLPMFKEIPYVQSPA